MRPFVLISPSLALMLPFLVVGGQAPPPHQLHAKLNSVAWKSATAITPQISGSKMTLQLPAASQIVSQIGVHLDATFAVHASRYHVMVPVQSSKPNLVHCFQIPAGWLPTNSTKRQGDCRISVEAAKAVTTTQTVTIAAFGTAGNKTLTLEVKPYTGPNHVASLQLITTGNRPNDLITFRVKLMSPVAAGQSQAVAWGLTPGSCFQQASPGASYNSGWTLNTPNTVTFTSGEIQRDLTVRIAGTGTCVGANRKFETWHPNNTSMMSAPAYQYLFFTINQPL